MSVVCNVEEEEDVYVIGTAMIPRCKIFRCRGLNALSLRLLRVIDCCDM